MPSRHPQQDSRWRPLVAATAVMVIGGERCVRHRKPARRLHGNHLAEPSSTPSMSPLDRQFAPERQAPARRHRSRRSPDHEWNWHPDRGAGAAHLLGATGVELRIACLTPGSFAFPSGGSMECSEKDARLFMHDAEALGGGGIADLKPGQTSIVIGGDPGTAWRAVTTYVKVDEASNPEAPPADIYDPEAYTELQRVPRGAGLHGAARGPSGALRPGGGPATWTASRLWYGGLPHYRGGDSSTCWMSRKPRQRSARKRGSLAGPRSKSPVTRLVPLTRASTSRRTPGRSATESMSTIWLSPAI